MSRPSASSRPFWIAAASLSVLILATVPVARPIQNYLSAHFSDRIFYGFTAAFVLIGIEILRRILRSPPDLRRRRLTGFVIVAALYAWRIAQLSVQVERFHLLEYGALAVLTAFGAMRMRAGWASFGFGVASGFAIGLIDEFFQWNWPGRYGEWRDVIINAEGSALALIALVILKPPEAMRHRPSPAALRTLFLLFAALGIMSAGFLHYTQTFGFMHVDPEIGRFKSFLSMEEFGEIDAAQYMAMRVAAGIPGVRKHVQDRLYWYDREGKEHFDRANLMFECKLDREGSMEAMIALRYFGPTLADRNMAFSPDVLDRIARTPPEGEPLLFSRVSDWLIVGISKSLAVTLALLVALFTFLAGFLSKYGRSS